MVLIQLLPTSGARGADGLVPLAETRELAERFNGLTAYLRSPRLKRRATAAGVQTIYIAPADCIMSNAAADNNHALRRIQTGLKDDVAVSAQLRFHANRRRRTARRR